MGFGFRDYMDCFWGHTDSGDLLDFLSHTD